MKTVKVLNLSGNRYVLPDGMTTMDIQSMVGFLSVLQIVGNEYDYNTSENQFYANNGIQLQLEELELGDKAQVKAHCAQSYVDYKAKKEALKAGA
jgi:lipopolysaccharide assembly outer membrane protein LptD (OstA)